MISFRRDWLGAIAEPMLRAVGITPPRSLFLLGHMRCGSSLLLHLLMTNPLVGGVGERNCPYRSRRDLGWQHVQARFAARPWLRPMAYVVDQVLHDQFLPRPSLLRDPRIRCVFMLRQPAASIGSLLVLSRTFYGDSWSPARATEYYISRVATLARLAGSMAGSGRTCVVLYEELLAEPQSTLERLRAFLELEARFALEYPVHAFTGTRGDPGKLIGSGRIQQRDAASYPPLDGFLLRRAQDAYEQCRSSLASRG